ncbi:hypothetical protein GOP47_0024844 [Adiantum capillus-veneris]|uniref:Pollen Ole e 1 allergen and extensin family protein n=1 Tax=Adiantum capillus-veneris TaxID=13818 RepID=A0A9D4U2J0_ADICA|nr:hypothetical protein GOP47_0024844 [Adiantum capillus-veneris]
MQLRRILALLLLTSLAFELALAGRGHGHYDEDGHYIPRKGKHGKAKRHYKPKKIKPSLPPPTIPIYVPPVVDSPDPPSVPPPIVPQPERFAPPAPLDTPAPPPSYVDEPPTAPPPSSPLTNVQGVVLCQNCHYVGTSYYSYGKPLPGAILKLVCKSTSEVKAETDVKGNFYLQVAEYVSVVEDCNVFLVSSSQSTCDTPTDINGGITGSPIRAQKNYVGEVQYISGPLVFAPTYCKPTPPPIDNSPPKPTW